MTQVAEFKVAHLYPPYQGKGKASIVSDKGERYKCEQSQLAQFHEGEDVAIHYLDESFTKNGELVKFKKFHSKIVKTNGAQPANKQFTRASTSNQDALHIYVNGKLAAALESKQLEFIPSAVLEATNWLVDIYNKSKLAGTKSQRDDGMEDEIPY